MLTAEKDIESLIMMSRINQLVVKVLLRSHQHLSVKFFQRYVLKGLRQDGQDPEENDTEKPSIFANTGPMITAEALWDSLDLQNCKIDRLILHQITKRKVEGFEDDFSDPDPDDPLPT